MSLFGSGIAKAGCRIDRRSENRKRLYDERGKSHVSKTMNLNFTKKAIEYLEKIYYFIEQKSENAAAYIHEVIWTFFVYLIF